MKKTSYYIAIAAIGVVLSSFYFHIQSDGAKERSSVALTNLSITDKSINEVNSPLAGKTIVLDPGHGGKDVGSIGSQGTYEKDVTLSTALILRQKLIQQGATVAMTRQDDTKISLQARTELAQTEHADLFISIHYDAFQTNDVYGMTTYYNKSQDQQMAQIIHDQLFESNIQTKDRGVQFGDYHVIRENMKPAVLLELGYISNDIEETRMKTKSFQEQVSTSITKGIVMYFKQL